MSDYQFQYLPLTGKLSGKQMIEQTERAINELAQIVNEGSAQVEVITNLANAANDNSEEALEKAQQALDTTGRVYINESSAVDIDDYYDSQLLYIEDSTSTHLPVADSGFLEVKTNDTKTACEQLFTADTDGQLYFRSGVITASTVGDVTVYSVEYSDWASYSTSAYVQAELEDYAELTDLEDYVTLSDLSTELGNYLPLAGGTMTGDITLTDGGNPLSTAGGTLTGEVDGVTPATSDNSTKLATTAWGVNALKQYAFLLDDSRTPTIPSNSNLNNYTTAGTYRATSSAISTTLSNCPISNSAFKLFVIEIGYGTFGSYGMQIILGIGRAIYVRNKTNNGWTAWGKLSYTDV